MAKLATCPDCGGSVSPRAPACPHCGMKAPSGDFFWTAVSSTTLIISLAFLGLALAIGNPIVGFIAFAGYVVSMIGLWSGLTASPRWTGPKLGVWGVIGSALLAIGAVPVGLAAIFIVLYLFHRA